MIAALDMYMQQGEWEKCIQEAEHQVNNKIQTEILLSLSRLYAQEETALCCSNLEKHVKNSSPQQRQIS